MGKSLEPKESSMVTKTNLKLFPIILAECHQLEEFQESASQWEPPPECRATAKKEVGVSLPGVFKVNMDGATFEEHNAYRVGVVIHNWRGRFITAKSMKFTGSMEASRAETMAASVGL